MNEYTCKYCGGTNILLAGVVCEYNRELERWVYLTDYGMGLFHCADCDSQWAHIAKGER